MKRTLNKCTRMHRMSLVCTGRETVYAQPNDCVRPLLVYRGEVWVTTKTIEIRIQVHEMKFLEE